MKPNLVLLCGGKGLRLREVLPNSPKTMAQINDAPFMKLLVDEALEQGIEQIILCTGYKGEEIQNYFSGNPLYRAHCVFSHENEPMGTGGAIRLCLDKVKTSDFIAINGDSYCGINYSDLFSFHEGHKAEATIVVAKAGDRRDGGYISLDKESKPITFNEKEFSKDAWINAGIYLFQKDSFAREVPAFQNISLEKDFFPKLIGGRFYAYKTSSTLYDIGTPERLTAFRAQHKKETISK